MPRRRLLPLALVAAVTLAACGDERDGPDYRLVTPPRYVGAEPVATPAAGPEPRMTAGDARRLRAVIAGWAAAVRRGDAARAAGYFALPAIVYQPSFGAVEVRTRAAARAFNDALPCGARVVATRPEGRYIVATFRLTDAAGGRCAAAGSTVAVGFVFGKPDRGRRFTEWWQVGAGPNAIAGPPERPAAPVADRDTFG